VSVAGKHWRQLRRWLPSIGAPCYRLKRNTVDLRRRFAALRVSPSKRKIQSPLGDASGLHDLVEPLQHLAARGATNEAMSRLNSVAGCIGPEKPSGRDDSMVVQFSYYILTANRHFCQ
jgi:hypothetical protein